uniref:Uncharacterized protein n=1 Tax=Anguilla anguilla TaxID=7936 RepID=A0A0E9QSZ5_ANGAN
MTIRSEDLKITGNFLFYRVM